MAPPLVATYRLQLSPSFGLDDAARVVPYLARLGISHLYLSPFVEAVRGSTHGYDVVDPTHLRAELGGAPAFERLVAAAHAHGLGLVADVVPNHMSTAASQNPWWWDVLENGPASEWAGAFDVDWEGHEESPRNVILLPVLGDHRHVVVARGEIAVRREDGRFVVAYAEHRFPLSPRSRAIVLRDVARRLGSPRWAFLADAHDELPRPSVHGSGAPDRRRRDVAVLSALVDEALADPATAAALEASLAEVSADPHRLEELLDRQSYRLAYHRMAQHDLDYRRFFDIDSLVALRMDEPRVLAATHRLIFDLVQHGAIDGLRIDHVDGLADPRGYLEAVRARVGDTPIWVEKILVGDETLPETWPTDGTTGYELATDLLAVSLPPDTDAIARAVERVAGVPERSAADVALSAREEILDGPLASDLRRLSDRVAALREHHYDMRDHSRHDLTRALRAALVRWPTYRTYVQPPSEIAEPDRRVVEETIARAIAATPDVDRAVFEMLGDVLSLRRTGKAETEVVRRFQQLTGPLMAKGVEDTAFYRSPGAIVRCEVGAGPTTQPIDPVALHARIRARARWPKRLSTTTTHDTKRSADARARLVAAMTEGPWWIEATKRFLALAAPHRRDALPDGAAMLAVWQSWLAAHPISVERLEAAVLKSAREAKEHTSWTRREAAYEDALSAFVRGALADAALVAHVEACLARIEPRARAVSLVWTVLACTLPGVPDFYQGGETWQHLLVDPDNRVAVDFAALERSERSEKQRLVRALLALRREHADALGPTGGYVPVDVRGERADRILAFRRDASERPSLVVAVTPRPVDPECDWRGTTVALPRGRWRSVFGGGGTSTHSVDASALFGARAYEILANTEAS